jgi:hypothetical protein
MSLLAFSAQSDTTQSDSTVSGQVTKAAAGRFRCARNDLLWTANPKYKLIGNLKGITLSQTIKWCTTPQRDRITKHQAVTAAHDYDQWTTKNTGRARDVTIGTIARGEGGDAAFAYQAISTGSYSYKGSPRQAILTTVVKADGTWEAIHG